MSPLEKLRAIAHNTLPEYEKNEINERSPPSSSPTPQPKGVISFNSFLSYPNETENGDTAATCGTVEGPCAEVEDADDTGAAPVAPISRADGDIWGEAEEERAAIIEHDGGVPTVWAEGFARLDRSRPPADVPPRRWQRFIDDIGLFLDRWAAYATALGWNPFDLFGCDRDRPFARIDKAGLLWLLNGKRVVMLGEDVAVIETPTGARQTYRRTLMQAGQVLVWELVP
jgi:hypothetical protein